MQHKLSHHTDTHRCRPAPAGAVCTSLTAEERQQCLLMKLSYDDAEMLESLLAGAVSVVDVALLGSVAASAADAGDIGSAPHDNCQSIYHSATFYYYYTTTFLQPR